jgi:hypothetical protein
MSVIPNTITNILSSGNTWINNGIRWTASASELYNDITPNMAFNNASYTSSNNVVFVGQPIGGNYNITTPFNYNTTRSGTDVSGIIIYGDWVQIQSNIPLLLNSYSFYTRNTVYSVKNYIGNLPRIYTIVGSNDGSTWYKIQDGNVIAMPGLSNTINASQNTSTYTITTSGTATQASNNSLTGYSTANNAYTYFRIIVTNLIGIGTYGATSHGPFSDGFLEFGWTPTFTISKITLTVALGEGINTIAYSSDGIDWIGLGTSIFSGAIHAAWNGTMWVAVGTGTNSIAYSYNGVIWTGLGTSIFSGASNVAWNGMRWVAVGSGLTGNNTIAYSNDGLIWTGLGKTIFSNEGRGVAWNGTIWVAVGWGTPDTIAYSNDGIIWTGLGNTIFSTAGYDVKWNGAMWVAVGTGRNSIAYSYNGLIWTGLGQTIFGQAHRIGWNSTRWVITGDGANSIAYSDNGLTWTGVTGKTIFSSYGFGVAWNGTRWVAVGTGNTHTIAYSNDGITWTGLGKTILTTTGWGIASSFINFTLKPWTFINSLVVNPAPYQGIRCNSTGQYVAVIIGTSGGVYVSSSYGANWKNTLSNGNGYISINYIGNYLISTSSTGLYISSSYGENWTLTSLPYATTIGWGGISMNSTGQYLVVGQHNVGVYVSSDFGNNWKKTFNASNSIYHTTSDSTGKYLAFTYAFNGIYTSSNYGNNWKNVITGAYQWFSVVSNSTGEYLAANAIFNGLYMSSNYGINWINPIGSRQWRDIAISSTGQYILATSLTNVSITSNYGNSWIILSQFSDKSYLFSAAISSNGQNLYLIANDGVYTNVNDIVPLTKIIVNNSNYTNVDLTYIFKPYTSGTKAIDTKMIVNGADLNNLFQPYQIGSSTKLTNLYVGTTDLAYIFNDVTNNLLTYPPLNMLTNYGTTTLSGLSYGNGTYITTSPNPGFVGYGPFYISPSSTPANRWQIGGAYNTASTYNGFTIFSLAPNTLLTTVSGVSYNGYWVQLELPYKIKLNKFSLVPFANGAGNVTQNVIVAGSNDNTNWTFLFEMKLQSFPAQNQRFIFDVNANTEFIQYRMILISAFGTSPTYFELQLHENPFPFTPVTFQPNETTHTTASWTYNGVNWSCSASSTVSGSYEPFRAFYNINVSNSISSAWSTTTNCYNGGTYNSNVSTVVSGTTIRGEWLEITSNISLRLYSYSFYTRNNYGGGAKNYITNLPRKYTIAGSNDNGTTWYRIQDGDITANPCPTLNSVSQNTSIYTVTANGTAMQSSNNNLTGYSTAVDLYKKFRVISISMISSSVSGTTSDNDGYLCFGWTPNFY